MHRVTFVVLVGLVPMLSGCNSNQPAGNAPANAARSDAAAPKTDQAGSPATAGEAGNLLRKLADFYRQKQSFQVDCEQEVAMEFGAQKNTMKSQSSISVARPNRIAIRQTAQNSLQMGSEVVCDGQQLSILVPPLKKYTQSPAPSTLDQILSNPMAVAGSGGRGPLLELFSSDPYKSLMQGVTGTTYAGREKIGDVDTHHVKCVQQGVDWELWFAAEGDPRLVQATFDMSKSLATASARNPRLKNARMILLQRYTNWQFDAPAPDDSFVFVAPNGMKKVDNFFEAAREPVSPLVGSPAPDVEQELLDGSRFSLKELQGKSIVILDFWATWCGPCVQEMPVIAKVADEYRSRGVALFCVNEREKPDTIRTFLDKKKLNVTVSLDSSGAAGQAYGVQGIPTLVLIDKAGIVQSVHVGFSPGIDKKLKDELDAILEGKNIAAEAKRGDDSQAGAVAFKGLEEAWKKAGHYSGVAVAADGKTIVALNRDSAEFLDAAGNQTRSVTLPSPGQVVRCARLTGQEPGELLLFSLWSAPLTAVDQHGHELWTQPPAIDDVWVADLDQDGKDEVIVGYNGSTGLHVFNGDGQRQWKDTSIGNVWHVTAGDLDGDGHLEVITTSAAGKVHLFDASGKKLDTLEPGIYAHMVRVFRRPGETADSIVVVGGVGQAQMIALDRKGDQQWQAELPDGAAHCDSLAFANGTTWAAASFQGGIVCVIDVRSGKQVAELKLGSPVQVAWSTADGEPLLLLASNQGLTAWRIKPETDSAP